MLLKVLLILSLVFISITESLIAYYELEDEETRRPAVPQRRSQQPEVRQELTEEAVAEHEEEDQPVSPLLFTRMARAGENRICGTQLTKLLMKICGGCVKPPGTDIITSKRSGFWTSPHKREDVKITDACCRKKCSHEFLKSFCC